MEKKLAAVKEDNGKAKSKFNIITTDVAALKELLYGSAQIQQTDDDGNGVVDADGNPVMIANPNIATAWPDEPS